MRMSRGVRAGIVVGSLAVAAVAALAIPAVGQTPAPAAPSAAEPSPTAPDKVVAAGPKVPITDPRQEGLMIAQDQFAHVIAAYPASDAGQVWDMDSETLTFRLVDNEPGRQERQAILALDLPVKIRFATALRSSSDLMKASSRLYSTRAEWAPALQGLGYIAPDVMRGVLILGVDQRYVTEWQAALKNAHPGVSVIVRGEPGAGVVLESLAAYTGRMPLAVPVQG